MATNANYQGNLNAILTAVYGRDVRQAIHDAIEYVGAVPAGLDDRIQTLEENAGWFKVVNGELCIVYNT